MKDIFELELSYEDSRGKMEQLETLLNSPGWLFLQSFLQLRKEGLERQLLGKSIRSQEDVALYNFEQGRLSELDLLPKMFESLLTDLKNATKQYQEQLAEEQENETE